MTLITVFTLIKRGDYSSKCFINASNSLFLKAASGFLSHLRHLSWVLCSPNQGQVGANP
ncbi:hypothetical protein PLIP_a2271 [Pseudoalteromonas lipolytica LMEB 39]|nr:hypothetical protein [Pseudoalteromonas lipolytica LMEB 39]